MEQTTCSKRINSWRLCIKSVLFVFSVIILLGFLFGWPVVVVVLSSLKLKNGVYCDQQLARFVLVSAALWLLLGLYSLFIVFYIIFRGDIPQDKTTLVGSIGFFLLLSNFGYWIYLQVRFFQSAGPMGLCPTDCSCSGYPSHTVCCDAVSWGLSLAEIVVMYISALMLFCYPCWVSFVWSRRLRSGLGRFGHWIGNASAYVSHMRSGQPANRLLLSSYQKSDSLEESYLLQSRQQDSAMNI